MDWVFLQANCISSHYIHYYISAFFHLWQHFKAMYTQGNCLHHMNNFVWAVRECSLICVREQTKGRIFNRIPDLKALHHLIFLRESTDFYLTRSNTINTTEVRLHFLVSNSLEWTGSNTVWSIQTIFLLKGLFHISGGRSQDIKMTQCARGDKYFLRKERN